MTHLDFLSRRGISILLVVFLSTQSLSAQSLWREVSSVSIPYKSGSERRIIPTQYRTLRLDIAALETALAGAPSEKSMRAAASPFTLSLPMPEGTGEEFRVVSSPVMAPELAAKYPGIKTYLAQGITNRSSIARLDITPAGFHAQVLSAKGDYYIDPYRTNDREHYVAYAKKNFVPAPEKSAFTCEVQPNAAWIEKFKQLRAARTAQAVGEELRTYRLAMAATGEYTAFHGGTKSGALAAIVTSVNRVVGIYEREVSIRLILIDGTDTLLYTNAATDPYNNDDGGTMLGQNQTTIDNLIGSANYDIGHVFSTGGGGIAFLGCVCSNGIKARGVTGSPSPTGDPFDVDYVAHEMGHQFGGNHTFNGTTGNCGGGNRNGSTAYEPGSGSTIMAYAGICGSDDIQSRSDAYFHAGSFDEITTFSSTSACAQVEATGNTAPIADASASGGYVIPTGTPFTLGGAGSDTDGDTLTYCWEQYDLGPGGSPNSPTGNAPLFRSFTPTASAIRLFPKLSDILNGIQTTGEILPTTARTLNFRLTVRDNRAGGGGVGFADLAALSVVASSGSFRIITGDVPTVWSIGTSQSVQWNVANTNASPVSCANVKISLSTDGGQTFPIPLAASTANDGEELIAVPNLETPTARIKVEAIGNIFFNISTKNITITSQQPPAPALVWSENFESAIFPPLGWLVSNPDGESQTWTRYASIPIFGTASASVSKQSNTSRNNDWIVARASLIEPKSTLRFWAKRQSSILSDSLRVWASETGNSVPSFTTLLGKYQLAFSSLPNEATQRFEIPLNAFAGKQIYLAFQYNDSNRVRVFIDSVTVDTTESLSSATNTDSEPNAFRLAQNYPNPFNPETVIEYALGTTSAVRLTVFDMLGREVQTLVNGRQASGRYSVRFNAANLSSGIYFYKLTASGSSGSQSGSSGSQGSFVETRKMLLVK